MKMEESVKSGGDINGDDGGGGSGGSAGSGLAL